MLAETIHGLAGTLRALWTLAPLWQGLACLGLLAAIWSGLHCALETRELPARKPSPGLGAPFVLTLAAITALGLCLRLYGRDTLPYWWDELLAVWMSQADLPVILRSLFTPAAPASDFTPPLFYLLLHGWRALFGDAEGALRLMTALLSTLSIPLAALLGRRLFSQRVGLTAALLLCISPPAIFYAQQIRCYALLGTLALAAALCALRAQETGRARDAVLLAATGTLFLYTHYVASWLWLGLGAATLAASAGGLLPLWGAAGALWARRIAGGCAACIAAFALAWLCPYFDPPLLRDGESLWPVALAALLGLVLLASRPWTGQARPRLKATLALAAAFALPALLLSLWMLPSGVLTVIGGAGSRIPGSYGFPEFARMLAEFSGPQAIQDPGMAGLGLFLVLSGLFLACVSRPRQAALILGWAGFPMVMAMAVQNPSMNLVRYLIATLPAVLLLMAVALCGACDGLARLLGKAADVFPARLDAAARLGAPLLLGAALLGYPAYTATQFPTTRANIENYPAVAARLAQEPSFLLVSESPNLTRAVSWYLDRQGRPSVTITPDSPRLAVVNTFLDGRLWHAQAAQELGLKNAVTIPGPFGEIALMALKSQPAGEEVGTREIRLEGPALRDALVQGRDVAFAGGHSGGLVTLYKKRPGRAVFQLRHDAAWAGRLAATLDGMVAGPGSFVRATVRTAGGDGWSEVLELRESGLSAGGAALPKGSALEFELPRELPPGLVEIEVLMHDDNSGVIYSSNAVLRSLTLRCVP